MKKLLFFLLSLLIGTGLFIWVFKTVGEEAIKNAFLVFTGWKGLVILGLTLLMMTVEKKNIPPKKNNRQINGPF